MLSIVNYVEAVFKTAKVKTEDTASDRSLYNYSVSERDTTPTYILVYIRIILNWARLREIS